MTAVGGSQTLGTRAVFHGVCDKRTTRPSPLRLFQATAVAVALTLPLYGLHCSLRGDGVPLVLFGCMAVPKREADPLPISICHSGVPSSDPSTSFQVQYIPLFSFFLVRTSASWQSPLTERYSRELSESGIRGGMFTRRAPSACPARYLCVKYLISSPKAIPTQGSPPSRPH